jgi:hypothetical protein
VAVGELLFELAGQALLDFMEAREERDGNEDDDGFFAMADFDLEEVGVSGEGSFDCSASRWWRVLVTAIIAQPRSERNIPVEE